MVVVVVVVISLIEHLLPFFLDNIVTMTNVLPIMLKVKRNTGRKSLAVSMA